MIYVIVILIGVVLLLYFCGRWLAGEAREIAKALRGRWRMATGQTPERLIRETLAAFAERGLGPPDLIAVPNEADKVHAALRRHVIDHVPAPGLPAAIGMVLAVGVDPGEVYLRAVSAAAGGVGAERADFVAFADVVEIGQVPITPHPAIASPAKSALELRTASGPLPYHLPVDPAWGLSPEDLVEHVRALIRERRRPTGDTIILR